MISGKTRRWSLLAVAGLLLVGAVAGARHYDLRGLMDQAIAGLRAAGPIPFFTAMAVLPAAGFPLSAFTLVAGPVFGPTLGLGAVVGCALLAMAVNVTLSYALAAYALRPVAERVVRWLEYPVPVITPKTAFLAIVILRVVPVTPFFLQSLLLGLARVPFGPYLLISVLIPGSYATALIVLGDGLMRGDRWAMAGAGFLFLVVGIVLHILRKRLGRTRALER